MAKALRRQEVAEVESGTLLAVFLNIMMTNQHRGLTEILAANDIDPANIAPGTYVAFINKKKDKVKVFAADGVLAYKRDCEGDDVLEVIARICRAFRGTPAIEASEAVALVLADM